MATCRIAVIAFLTICIAYLTAVDGVAVMSVDFGSEFIKVAIVKPGVPMEIALNKESRRKTPNILSMRDGERLFGDPAMNTGIRFPKFAFRFLLHLMGQKFDSLAVEQYKTRFPHHKLVADDVRGTVCIDYAENEVYCVEELVAMMLNNSRETASTYAEQPVKDCVIVVPAYFTQAQRQAMLYAAQLVGLNVLQLLNSHASVALNYGVFRRNSFNATEQNIMFFDMGSSSTIASIVSYQTTKVKELGFSETIPQLTVRAVGFDRTLGGLEMDMRLRDHLADIFDSQKKSPESVRKSPRAMAKLLKEANRVKQVLSANSDHFAQIEGLLPDIDFRAKVTREEFEKLCADLFDRVQAPVEQALKAAEMDATDIEQVIIVGGGSRVPKVQQLLLEVTKKTELGKSVNSDEAAALGASYAAAGLSKAFRIKKFGVRDVSFFPMEVAFDRQIEDGGTKHVRRVLYNRNNLSPQKKIMTFNKFQDDFEFALDYGDLSHLSKEQAAEHGPRNVTTVSVEGVGEIFRKHDKDNIEPKGIKAHFNLDSGNVLSLDHIEALFERAPAVGNDTEKESTFSNLVDGLSNFFSSKGSSDESKGADSEQEKAEPDADADKPKGESEKGESAKPEPERTDSVNATASGNATESNSTSNATATKKKPQPVMLKESLTFTVSRKDIIPVTEVVANASRKRLTEMTEKDLEKALLEAAKNSLEAYIFDMQDKMYSDEFVAASEEEERTNVTTTLSAASDWLYEEGEDADRKAFNSKLASLKKAAKEIVTRVTEHRDRPGLVKEMRSSLNTSRYFVRTARNFTKPSPGYVDSLYTKVEVDTLEKLANETETWLNDTLAKQDEMKLSADPVLTIGTLKEKAIALEREMYYLSNKAKYFIPTKKKVNTTAKANAKNATSNATAGNSTAGDASNATTEEAPTSTPTEETSSEFPSLDPEEFIPPTEKTAETPKKKKPKRKTPETTEGDETLALPDGDEDNTNGDTHQEL